MLHLKDDMDVSSLTFLGTIAHILGPIYLSECFPKVTVLNLAWKKLFVNLSCFLSIFNKCEIQFHGRDNDNQLSYDMFSLGMGLHSFASREEAPLYECIGTLDPDT